jgi:hypothetical protein
MRITFDILNNINGNTADNNKNGDNSGISNQKPKVYQNPELELKNKLIIFNGLLNRFSMIS